MKQEYESRERKAGKFKLKMTFAIIILAALSIVELYLMMNYQAEYLYLGIVGLGILCFVYWIVDISFKMQQENDDIEGWEYENLYKAEKVSYISMKQSFSDIEKTLQDIADLPVEDVIQSQKAVGKVMVQRNKENTQTILDSHKELAERIDAVEAKINELKEMLNGVSAQTGGETQNHQQEILDILQRLEGSVAQGIQISQETVKQEDLNFEESIVKVAEEDENAIEEAAEEPVIEEEPIVPEEAAIEEEPAELEATSDETPVMEESTETEEESEEAPAEAPVLEEPTAAEEESEASLDEAPAVEEPTAIEEEPEATSAEAPVMEEPAAAEEEPTVKEEAAEAPIIPEEKPDMPNLSDPNHVMTPEEIAALLANM